MAARRVRRMSSGRVSPGRSSSACSQCSAASHAASSCCLSVIGVGQEAALAMAIGSSLACRSLMWTAAGGSARASSSRSSFARQGNRRGHGRVFVRFGDVRRGVVAGLVGGALVVQRGAEVVGAHPSVEQAGGGFEDVLDRAAELVGVAADRGECHGLAGRFARLAVERAQDGGELGSGVGRSWWLVLVWRRVIASPLRPRAPPANRVGAGGRRSRPPDRINTCSCDQHRQGD